MKVCKLKPDYNKCCNCFDYQINNSIVMSCDECLKKDKVDYQIIKEYKFLFWKYVVILKDNKKVRVKADRVYDVREN